ncbi:MAG: 1-acyl-sn-glycerol-3-phosphate acyltransferase [Anaerolineae bacterium]|nr:1-acyl-sn-glycerol-3-phosphate acyltransferase [Anaerolineae bacterium]
MTFKLVRFIIRIVMKLIARIEVRNAENIPSGNFIMASNHLGRLDSAVLLYIFDREDIIMPVAEKYKNHPIFGVIGRAANAVWLNRFDTDFHALREMLKRMKEGGMLVIAPEGTRSKTGALQPGKAGVSYLAAKSGYPVLPVALTGTEDRYVVEQLKHFRRIHITATAGKLMTLEMPQGKNREQILADQTEEIMCQIAALLPKDYHGVYADNPRLKELMENA